MITNEKLIFLDIDGVLNYRNMSDPIIVNERNKDSVCKSSVNLLNELISETDAKLVLSSAWRFFDDAFEILNNRAGIKGEFIGKTSSCCTGIRGAEIYDWMRHNVEKYHDFQNYVILDDDSDMLMWQAKHFIKIDNYTGLTPNSIYKAKRILSGIFH